MGAVLCGAVVILAGFGVAIIEVLRFPKGSIWGLVGATVVLIAMIRWFDRRA